MTTLMLALPLSNPIRGPVKKRRVLLVDTSPSKRELRAETMRRLGMDVDCAADISEARSWWRADLYNLVLINMENEQGHRDKFCDDVRSATPQHKRVGVAHPFPGPRRGGKSEHRDRPRNWPRARLCVCGNDESWRGRKGYRSLERNRIRGTDIDDQRGETQAGAAKGWRTAV